MANLMDYNDGTLTEDQLELRDMVHDFLAKKLVPIAAELDREGRFPTEVWKMACDMGLSTVLIPEEFGGSGISYLTNSLLFEEYGWADGGWAATMGAHSLSIKPVLFGGDKEQIGHFAEVISGAPGAFALTEADAGSDAASIRTTAVKKGDEYVINGSKCFITNAEVAEVFVIFATVDRGAGVKGITAFMVDRDTPGFTIGKHEDKLGIRSSVTNELSFIDMKIPAKNRIGAEGEGFALAMKTLDIGRADAAASANGLSRAAIEHAVNYAQQRVTMGKPIIKHQGITFMLADMAAMLEAGRQMAWYACRLLDTKSPRASAIAAMAKLVATDNAMKITTDAIQVLGGFGYSREYPVEKLFRDAKIIQIFEGTNQIQRVVVGGWLPKLYN